jgi:hypothetical protein
MKITFQLFSGSGLESTNTLSVENFAEFQKIATQFKQSLRIKSVQE